MAQAPQRPLGSERARLVRDAVEADVPAIAALHRRNLGHGLYPKLGERFLRHYHAAMLESPHSTCLAVGPVGEPVGFVVAVLEPRAHREWLRGRAALELALHGLLGLLSHPRALVLFLRTRVGRYVRALLGRGPIPTPSPVPAVLLHVAVAPSARGEGIGGALADEVVDAAGRAGRETVRLVTETGSDAERFYERRGWRRRDQRWGRDGVPVTEFEHPTPAAGA